MSRGFSSYILIALLLLATVAIAIPALVTPVKAAGGSAWLKIVSTEWVGVPCAEIPSTTPMCPAGVTFPERYNITSQRAFVEVYSIDPKTLTVKERQFIGEPNATGFVKIEWGVPDDYGLLILVKAKSYYGERIGAGTWNKGIIMYALVVGPSTLNDFAENMVGSIYDDTSPDDSGFYVRIDGSVVDDFDYPAVDVYMPGVFGFYRVTSLADFKAEFGAETADKTPANAWVATAAVIFPRFYVHSFYDYEDAVPFAQVKIYDLDHTNPTKSESLLQAFVTGEDGYSRYTREIYPTEQGLTDGVFENNPIVPIPLQVINLKLKQAYNEIMDRSPDYGILWPHLNVTARVWWETVVVGHAIFYGHTANGTTTSDIPFGPVDPLSSMVVPEAEIELWATVLYGRFCTYDADPSINFPTGGVTGDELINAVVGINLKTKNDVAYYVTKNLLTTDEFACTNDPHKYRGGLQESTYMEYARFPNATIWIELYGDADESGVPDYFEALDVASFWAQFGGHVYFNASVMYDPADAKNRVDIPESQGSKLTDVEKPRRIGDEDVLKSDYYEGNWSMLVADVSYANTLTLNDDKPYTGLDVIVKWKGGWRNVYPGSEDQVAAIRVKNPYGIAVKYDVIPFTENPAEDWLSGYAADITTVVEGECYEPPVEYIQDYREGVGGICPIEEDGYTFIWAHVYDIEFIVVDQLGNPLPAGATEVCLRLPNGAFYCRVPSLDEMLETGLMWSYANFGEGHVVFFQLPGNKGPYGVRVTYMGVEVYYRIDEINYLKETVLGHPIRVTVYKAKIVFLDCQDKPVHKLWVRYTSPAGITDWVMTTPDGELDFPFIPGGVLTIHGTWFKGVEIPLMRAEDAAGRPIPLTAANELRLDITEGIDTPIKVWVPIKDIIFYTSDFQGEFKIPYLNITVTWIGTPKPWSTERIYYLETLDPTDDINEELFNTTKTVHPLWFSYKIEAFFQKIAEDSPMTGLVEYESKYVFYQMPPAIYNITVTTVVGGVYADEGMETPGVSLWPGRTDAEVPYEIKIDWKGWSEEYKDTVPEIRTGPAEDVNDRVVLRIFGSMNGVPVTTANFPAWLVDALNPDLIGIRTALVCEEEITLKTWAHDFWMRVIDGDLRVGDASFKIVNDNGGVMRWYDVAEEMWRGETFLSDWMKDIKAVSVLDKDSLAYSPIFWNGSYNLTSLYFETNMTYIYSKGENASFIVDKFYNASAPNTVADVLNFTLVGTENLWKTSSRFTEWAKRITGKTWKNWFDGWFVVYELPRPADEYRVEAAVDGKGVLPVPIPVAFIKLAAFAKDGKTPLANALIELWIAHLDVKNKVKISEEDEGCKTIDYYNLEICWRWEKKIVEAKEPQVFEEKRWDRVWLTVDGTTIFVQVPPSPAKLLLRNVVDGVDMAVSADYVYVMIETTETPNGLLAYGRWYTDADGYVNSLKGLEKADPRYGAIVLPTSGWLNATFHDDDEGTEDEFHYQINVVWRSAVVYSDNVVLGKNGYAIGPTEVYNVRFMFTLCNSTDTADAVRDLNLWIYYPNVTEWHEEDLWKEVPPAPQDYEACEDSAFGCDLRVTLVSSKDADGIVSFDLIPGPRFMNTTWKYVFSANHTAIDWLDDLVHTKLVLNNETFGDGALRTAGKLSIDVPIMLAAAKEVNFVVLTWRDEAGRLVPYPIQGYTVKYAIRNLDAGIIAAEGSGVTDATGTVNVKSGTEPTKTFWVGMTVRYRVEPPAYTSDYSADFWKAWLTGKEVELVDKKAEYVKPTVEPKMTHAYFPDESPSAYAITKIDTTFANRTDNKYDCIGLCVFNARSKPFLVQVNYTAVTVQVQDFNGRPIEGVLVMLVDKATGKLAAWHYTAGTAWTAKPVDDVYLKKYHAARLADEDRSFGGAGYTGVMNVSIGPVMYDVDGDDKVDKDLRDRGIKRFVTYIVRAFYLPAQEKVNDEAMKPVWPYLLGVAQEVYNSERDQIEWKVMLPRALPNGRLDMSAYEAPTGSLLKEHADVRAAVFDAKLRFGYEGKTLTDEIRKDLKVVVKAEEIRFKAEFSGRDTISLLMLPRGTYTIEVTWKGETVARKTFDLSTVNIGTVPLDIELGLTDAIFAVKDMAGRAVPVAADKVSIENGPYASISVKDNKVNVVAMVKSKTYTVAVSYTGYGKTTAASYVGLPEGLKELVLPVGDIAITVVDVDGRPVGGATVKLEGVETKTDSQGRALFQMVPLEDEAGRPISYSVTVTREKTITDTITTSRASTDFKLLYGLGDIKVIVRGAAGQPLAGARVDLLSAGALVGTAVTDDKGEAMFTGLAEGTYTVKVDWKTFKDEKSVTLTEADIMAKVPKTVEFALPPFTEIAGIPLDFGTFVALIVGIILLVIVLAIIISEYVRWRGRRLGIYPPPPPKK